MSALAPTVCVLTKPWPCRSQAADGALVAGPRATLHMLTVAAWSVILPAVSVQLD